LCSQLLQRLDQVNLSSERTTPHRKQPTVSLKSEGKNMGCQTKYNAINERSCRSTAMAEVTIDVTTTQAQMNTHGNHN
jgi:hypothetical protein